MSENIASSSKGFGAVQERIRRIEGTSENRASLNERFLREFGEALDQTERALMRLMERLDPYFSVAEPTVDKPSALLFETGSSDFANSINSVGKRLLSSVHLMESAANRVE